MNSYKNKLLIIFITLFSFNYLMADCTDLPSNDNTLYVDASGAVWYNFTSDVAGFQFNLEGTTMSGASGGAAASAGFTVSAGGSTALGFSFTGATISSGSGILTELTINGTPTGLSGIVLSDTSSSDVTGSTSTSLCDESGGDDGGTDGDAVCTDLPTDNNTLYVDASGTVWYNFTSAIAGFQFNLEGTTMSGASGGAAASAGFTVSAGGSTALGFSFTGATISSGSGILTELTINGTPTGLSGIVLSDPSSSDVTGLLSTSLCSEGTGDGGCDWYDCAGVCDGDAIEDECGVCSGDGSSCANCDEITDEQQCNDNFCNWYIAEDGLGYCENGFPECLTDCPNYEVWIEISPGDEGQGTNFCNWLLDDIIPSECSDDCDDPEITEVIDTFPVVCTECLEAGDCDLVIHNLWDDNDIEDCFDPEEYATGDPCIGYNDQTVCESDDSCYWEDDGDGNAHCEFDGPPLCVWDCEGICEFVGENENENPIDFCNWMITTLVDGDCSSDCDEETSTYLSDAIAECELCLANGDPDSDDCNIWDDEDDCASGYYDCAGVCDGDAIEDECNVCGGDGSSCSGDAGIPSEWDIDGDGFFDDINSYQNSGSVTSRIYLDGVDAGSDGDALAAFVDGEQRGYILPTEVPVPLGGGYAFLLLIYSNEASGETITFQFYDNDTDTVYDIDETYEFVSDMVLGNVVLPEILNVSLSVDVSKDISLGWNWISLNVNNDDMSLDSVFSSIGNSAEFIKNQSLYADYYQDFGWFGTLTDIDNVSMYKLKMLEDATFNLTGMPVDVDETVLDLGAGFNWIGYTPQLSWDLSTALSNIPEGSAQFIKSQSLYADYYDSFGWFGTLENMDPLLGYVISLLEDTEFAYNEDDFARLSTSMVDVSDDRFDLDMHDYEYNATITSSLYIDDSRVDTYDYTLAAFDGLSCVGYTDGLYFPFDGNIIFPLMVYGNDEGSNLTFRVYDNISGDHMDIDEGITFVPDMKLGDGFNPIEFHNLENPDNYVISSAYPNPFNPVVNFDIELDGSQYVQAKVYNISGQEIAVLQEGMLSGKNKINWTAVNQSSGIYFIQVSIDGQMITNNKIILLK